MDFIPLLVTVDEESPRQMTAYSQKRIEMAAVHGINFISLYFNPVLKEKWQKVVKLIFPEKLEPTDLMILFNFQGKFEGKERDILHHVNLEVEPMDRSKRGKKEKICSLMCTASYTSTSISLSISSTIEPDISRFKQILDENKEKFLKKA